MSIDPSWVVRDNENKGQIVNTFATKAKADAYAQARGGPPRYTVHRNPAN